MIDKERLKTVIETRHSEIEESGMMTKRLLERERDRTRLTSD